MGPWTHFPYSKNQTRVAISPEFKVYALDPKKALYSWLLQDPVASVHPHLGPHHEQTPKSDSSVLLTAGSEAPETLDWPGPNSS